MEYVRVKENLPRRWQRCKEIHRQISGEDGEKTFWEATKEAVRRSTKDLIEVALDLELTEQLGAKWYERTAGRRGSRNGGYRRSLDTRYGVIEGIRVPRPRRGGLRHEVFGRYQRRQEAVDAAVTSSFVCGVSTRRVQEALWPLLETRLSAGTVSRVTKRLGAAVRRYHRRAIVDDYRYLFLDGITVKVHGAAKVVRKLVLVAYGVTVEGKRQLIDFRVAPGESQRQWEALLTSLQRRGLKEESLELVTTDGCKGLHAALDVVYPEAPRQLCWAHKMRNVADKLPRKHEGDCIKGARRIYLAKNKRQAVRRFKAWSSRWEAVAPKAVKCLAQDIDILLNFLEVPKKHRKLVRTTNVIERTFREVRRRIRPMSAFPTMDSCDRIVYTVFAHLNEVWEGRPLKGFTQSR
jgi:putative transposase